MSVSARIASVCAVLVAAAVGWHRLSGIDSAAAAPAQGCVAPAQWTLIERDRAQPTSPTALLAQMARRDVVLLGESHDEEDDHRWQLQVLAALQAQRPRMVIGFEMFPRRVQPVLDRWVAGELTPKELLDQVDWDNTWRLPASLYLPLFEFARINRVPMVALNVDQKVVKAITAKGWDAVAETEREGVGRPAAPAKAYRDFLFDAYREHATIGAKGATPPTAASPAFGHFVEAQTTWDRAMAEALARRVAATDADRPLVVGIMGSGHIRHGYGVPHQLRALSVTSIGALLPVRSDIDCGELRAGLADAVFALPPAVAPKAPPPRLGVRLEETDGVRIAEVTAGSLAEVTGLKAGDQLIQVADGDVKGAADVIAAVRRQPPGTWLPIRVKRGDQTLDLVIRFPAKR